jgi:hypothetical protein
MCFLGQLRSKVTSKRISRLLLEKAVTRTVNKHLHEKLRATGDNTPKVPEPAGLLLSCNSMLMLQAAHTTLAPTPPGQTVLVEYFDLVFRPSEESTALWEGEIRQRLEAKFPGVLSPDERVLESGWQLRANVNMRDLFVSLSQRNGIQWKDGTAERVLESGATESLADAFVAAESTGTITADLCFLIPRGTSPRVPISCSETIRSCIRRDPARPGALRRL